MKKLTIILTSCLIVVSMLALPIETRAKTISQFEAEAEKLTKELEEQKSKLVTNEKEIKEIKAKISDIENKAADVNVTGKENRKPTSADYVKIKNVIRGKEKIKI